MIKIQNLTKTFQVGEQQVTALDNVNLEVPQGGIYGIIGSSGAGKSTLIRCVNLLEEPTSGHVIVDGEDLTALSKDQMVNMRRNIGMIFQHFNLLNARTAFGNVAVALELIGTPKAKIKQKVTELLELVGLADRADYYPSNLSGGQKQRVAIARALATDPKVLLCDEGTSALDPATTQSILLLLKEINQRLGITILLITHEMHVVKQICDSVAIIDKGKLVEQGSVINIFSDPQTELAKDFINSTMNINLPQEYLDRLHPESESTTSCIVKVSFIGGDVDRPLLSMASKKYDVEISILTAQIDYIGQLKFGVVIAEIIGNSSNIEKTKKYFIKNKIKVEVLGYV